VERLEQLVVSGDETGLAERVIELVTEQREGTAVELDG
jgi:hypothetical protein